jgi:short-subunit dehydrogenase
MMMRKRWMRVLAWTSLIGSFPVWGAAFFAAPFLPLTVAARALWAGGFIAAGEAMFWGAGAFLGAEVLARFRVPKVNTGRSFVGQRVVVVGATGGLGEAVARAAVREGAEVCLVGRNASKLEALGESLGAKTLSAELTNPESIRHAAAQLGEVDFIVCATGIDVRKPFAAHTDEELAHELEVDLLGPIHLVRAMLGSVREGGRMALFGGFADGRLALPYYSVDVAARAGLASYCESVNRELALTGKTQRLCYVCPAPADTQAERAYKDLWQQMGSKFVSPEQVADFVLANLLARKTVAVMGRATRALAALNALSPTLADVLFLRRIGRLLQERFDPRPVVLARPATRAEPGQAASRSPFCPRAPSQRP